jgi:hypothetical protein
MSQELLKSLVKEIEALEGELKGDPRCERLIALNKLYRLYAIPEEDGKRSRTKAETQVILDEVARLLKNRPLPTPTAEILRELNEKGITVPGDNPQNNLSAMLSYSEFFKSHGRHGWTLVLD